MFYFPMAGISSRFSTAGYKKPKYYLDVGELTLFQASLRGFSKYFQSDDFCFIYLEKFISEEIIRNWAESIGLPRSNCHLVPLTAPTKGQAQTVKFGIQAMSSLADKNEEIFIFNIDTIYHDFEKPSYGNADFLDVTRMPGTHWSFVEPDNDRPKRARRVVEKERISELCSVGLYGFRSAQRFHESYCSLYEGYDTREEQYVAPMYQHLINNGFSVTYREWPNDRFEFIGTPDEYERYLLKNRITKNI